jgi:hypothetical protein
MIKCKEAMIDGDPTLAGCEIQEESTLHLVQRLHGGGYFVDLENLSSLKKRPFSKKGSYWRIVTKGFNIKGTCTNIQS